MEETEEEKDEEERVRATPFTDEEHFASVSPAPAPPELNQSGRVLAHNERESESSRARQGKLAVFRRCRFDKDATNVLNDLDIYAEKTPKNMIATVFSSSYSLHFQRRSIKKKI